MSATKVKVAYVGHRGSGWSMSVQWGRMTFSMSISTIFTGMLSMRPNIGYRATGCVVPATSTIYTCIIIV